MSIMPLPIADLQKAARTVVQSATCYVCLSLRIGAEQVDASAHEIADARMRHAEYLPTTLFPAGVGCSSIAR
jgi:hypothetical protein